jgi:hypothetical protein
MSDLNTLLIITVSTALTVIFSKIIGIVFEWAVRLILVTIVVKSDKLIREIDQFLVDTSQGSDICQDSTKKPLDSFHIRFLERGFIIASRSTAENYHGSAESYIVWGTRHAIDKLRLREQPTEAYKLKISNFESTGPWQSSFITSDEEPHLSMPLHGQEACVDAIMYESRNKSILLTGEPGVGKTNVALFLAMRLCAHIVFGYDLTAPGVSLDNLWRLSPSEDTPVILVLDEIDGAFACANTGRSAKEHRCLAQNKTALNTLFDRFEKTKHLIILATSNKTFADLQKTYPAYIRRGRFDLCFTLTKDECKLNVH